MSGGPSPQVIKRGDTYVVHNLDVNEYAPTQRVGLAILVWPQVRKLMEINGDYKERDYSKIGDTGIGTTADIDRVVAKLVNAGWSRIGVVRPRMLKRPDIVERAVAGEFNSLHDIQRALGMKVRSTLAEGADSQAKLKQSYYGKGDKFDEAIEPLLRYLAAHEKRGFQYPHVAPRAAHKRVAVLDKVIADLGHVKEDLESRSHVATLSAPFEKRRKETS